MRLFTAIQLPPDIKENIYNDFHDLRNKIKGSWVKKENLHVTLKFLGEVEDEKVSEIKNLISGIKIKPFESEAFGTGAFPNMKNPKVLWVGISKGNEEIKKIMFSLDEVFSKLGFKKEGRDYTPHITVARLKEKTLLEKPQKTYGKFLVDGIKLFQSILKTEGAVYKEI